MTSFGRSVLPCLDWDLLRWKRGLIEVFPAICRRPGWRAQPAHVVIVGIFSRRYGSGHARNKTDRKTECNKFNTNENVTLAKGVNEVQIQAAARLRSTRQKLFTPRLAYREPSKSDLGSLARI
jgi:hypothetical protein